MRTVAVVCTSAALATAGHARDARTASAHSGDYLSLIMYGAIAQVDDITANTGTVIVNNDNDGTGGIGFAVGYNWAKKGLPIRSEFEYSYRFRFDYDIRIANQAGYENNLSSHVFFANAYYDFSISERWTAYLGGGVGAALN